MYYIIFALLAYLLGSVPTAVWIGKSWYSIDIRQHGSKNAGATNTFRILGKKAGIIVLSIDIIKGFLAAFLPYLLLDYPWHDDQLIPIQLLSAFMAVVGHVLPVFAGFNGGKGVATSLGVIIGVHPEAAGICVALFLLVFIISKYVSLGAITAAVAFPLLIHFAFHNRNIYLTIFSMVLSFLVIYVHKKNIKRLLQGNENKMNLFHREA